MADHAPRWLRWVTRVSLLIGITALVTTVWLVGLGAIEHHLRSIGWFFVVLCTVELTSSSLDGTAIYFMTHGEGRPSWREAIVAQIVGRGVNAVTPGGNLGEALKIGLLSQRCPPSRIVAAVMYVGIVAIVITTCVIAIGSGATAFLFDVPPIGQVALLVAAFVALGAASAIIVLVRRGMLTTISKALARIRLISEQRREQWNDALSRVDARLLGSDDGEYRRRAIACIVISQLLQKGLLFFTILAAGYLLSPGQYLALLSAGQIVGWISSLVPMGLGMLEGGNVALFTLIGAPAAIGLALALARRVNQIVFASIGFLVLAADRVGRVHLQLSNRLAGPESGVAAAAGLGTSRFPAIRALDER